MSEMVERAARAMREADPLGRGYRGDWPAYVSQARAAIEAMREPTEGMEKAGAARWDDDWCTETNALNMWQTMIDAALK